MLLLFCCELLLLEKGERLQWQSRASVVRHLVYAITLIDTEQMPLKCINNFNAKT